MVLTRRSAAAIHKQRLNEEIKKPEQLAKGEEEGSERAGTETHPDGTPLAKEDADKSGEQAIEKMDGHSIENLAAAACRVLRKARVDAQTVLVDSDDDESEEDCMEAEGMSGNFISLSGADLVEEKSMKKKKKRMKKDLAQLSSRLQPGLPKASYLTFDKFDFVRERLQGKAASETFLKSKRINELLVNKTVLTADVVKEDTVPVRTSKYKQQKLKKAAKEHTAGDAWFNLPATPITPELRNDLKVLRMRGAIDPQRHYKKADSKELPKFFQVGRVVGGPLDFYSGRVPKKQRRSTIVGELMADMKFRKFQKRKFQELQEKSSSGTRRYRKMKKRGHYKK